MFWKRALTAAIGIPLGLFLVYLGGWWLAGVVALLALLGMAEFYRLTALRSLKAYLWLGYPLGLLSVALPALPRGDPTPWQVEVPVLCLGLLALLVWAAMLFPNQSGGRLLATIVGVGYVAHLLSYLLRLRALVGPPLPLGRSGIILDFGALCVAGVLVICWGMDTAAYAVGKTIGRHKLCPSLSPGKTIEGALAALLAATLLGMGLFACLPGSAGLPTVALAKVGVSPALLVQGALFGALLGIAGQLGDLFESLLKRRAGVKDSGALLPGHGGVLDRFDSLLFNAPAAFFYLRILLHV